MTDNTLIDVMIPWLDQTQPMSLRGRHYVWCSRTIKSYFWRTFQMKVIKISYFDLFDKNVSAIYLVCPRANIIF